jgi:hypothetical protein
MYFDRLQSTDSFLPDPPDCSLLEIARSIPQVKVIARHSSNTWQTLTTHRKIDMMVYGF